MQFTARQRKLSPEERLARWAIAFLGSSLVLLAALFGLAFTVAARSTWVVVAISVLAVYATQCFFLGSIGKFEARHRLLIWQLSFLGHGLLFAAVLWFTGDPSVTVVLMLPETASSAIHLVGMHHASRARSLA